MRLSFLLVLLAMSASAQTSDRLGFYGVVGSAAPERILIPSAADPVVVIGARLTPAIDVHAGLRLDNRQRDLFVSDRQLRPTRVGTLDETTRAATASVGVAGSVGWVSVRLRGSGVLDWYRRDISGAPSQPRGDAPDEPEPLDSETTSDLFGHAGASAVVSIPLVRGRGQIAPGLGIAVSATQQVSAHTATTPSQTRVMPFVSVPTTLSLDALDVTLDATLGMAKGAGSRFESLQWAPVVEAALRLDI